MSSQPADFSEESARYGTSSHGKESSVNSRRLRICGNRRGFPSPGCETRFNFSGNALNDSREKLGICPPPTGTVPCTSLCGGPANASGRLLSVRWENVDLRAGFLTIPGEQRKGGRQGRVYRLTPDCREWLARIREPQRETVWPWPWSYHSLWPRYKQILKNAGLPFGRERMFHCIRKSHASHLEAAGGCNG